MTTNYLITYPTGLFIPVEKQSLFMVAFEDMLVSNHRIVPLFGQATKRNTCEVKFKYLGNKSYKPECFASDVERALEFIKTNMSILGPKKSKRKAKSNRFQSSPQVITLGDESEVRTVDLTNVNHCEPEVIVLEDSIVHLDTQSSSVTKSNRTMQSSSCSVVDLTELGESKTPAKSKETDNDIQILNIKRFIPESNQQIKVTIPVSLSSPKNKNKRKRKLKCKKSLTSMLSSSPSKSESLISLSSTDSLPRKKRKLQDISNISSSSKSPSSTQSSLSENTLKYYEKISVVVGKTKRGKKGSSNGNCNHARNLTGNNINLINPKKKVSPVRVCMETNKKRKAFTHQNNFGNKNILNYHRKCEQSQVNVQISPRRSPRNIKHNGTSIAKRAIGETNSFNPNPCEIEVEGLRPIVIDGCNVAIGHGKGKFSPKGLKICVDYFSARGHTTIKVFLPQFREVEFSTELLESLKAKCDVIFTPSQCINGQRRTPYDDRFIVQYATEFGGVIVSTDNFRDLARENPRWQDTIAKRLLMFTWVDDFLMFPVDPLGRSGPTLEKFLRF